MHLAKVAIGLLTAGAIAIGVTATTRAQPAASGPPAVGVVEAAKRPITETSEFLGRIEAVNRVNVVARVTAFLEKRLFNEGAEVEKGWRCPAHDASASQLHPIATEWLKRHLRR
jgi:membrane fusion protein (multidrug efflux system)